MAGVGGVGGGVGRVEGGGELLEQGSISEWKERKEWKGLTTR